MTAGQKIRKEFGLENLPNVMIGKVLTRPIHTFFVVFDTRRPTLPISNHALNNFPFYAMIYDKPKAKKPFIVPFVHLDRFQGSIDRGYFLFVDLAGRFIDDRLFTKIIEDSEQAPSINYRLYLNSLVEGGQKLEEESGYTIDDFLNYGVSGRNMDFLMDREMNGRSGSELTSLTFNKRKNTLLLGYKVVPTYDSKVGITVKNFDAGSAGSYVPYARTGRNYKVNVLFSNIDYHVGSKEEFLELEYEDQVAFIRDMIRTCPVQVHSNDKSFYFQGVWENGSKLGFSIYPFMGTMGTGEWSYAHKGDYPEYYLTKHLVEVLNRIQNYPEEIVDKIRNKYM